jgi:hypothetical protein
MAPALAAAAAIDEQGYYDGEICEQACAAGGDTDVEGCYPATVAATVANSRTVLCKFDRYPYDEFVTVPAAELDAVPVGAFELLAQSYCEQICARGTDPVKECQRVVAPTPPPRPDQPFVVCELYRGAHCAGPSLSRGAGPQPSHTATDCAATPMGPPAARSSGALSPHRPEVE